MKTYKAIMVEEKIHYQVKLKAISKNQSIMEYMNYLLELDNKKQNGKRK